MRVGSNSDIGKLLAYQASQRQQRFSNQFQGTRNFPDALKRGEDTFSRTTRGLHDSSRAHHLRSEPHELHGRTLGDDRSALSPQQIERLKAKVAEAINPSVDAALTPTTPETPSTENSAPPVYTQSDLDDLLKLFGSVQGDDAFDSTKDFNADGKIDVDDLNHVLSNLAAEEPAPAESEPVTYTQNDIDNLLKVFGSVDGDDAFDTSMDMNGDGKIDVDDLNHMLSNIEEPSEG